MPPTDAENSANPLSPEYRRDIQRLNFGFQYPNHRLKRTLQKPRNAKGGQRILRRAESRYSRLSYIISRSKKKDYYVGTLRIAIPWGIPRKLTGAKKRVTRPRIRVLSGNTAFGLGVCVACPPGANRNTGSHREHTDAHGNWQ